jgi:hypothetical protein
MRKNIRKKDAAQLLEQGYSGEFLINVARYGTSDMYVINCIKSSTVKRWWEK